MKVYQRFLVNVFLFFGIIYGFALVTFFVAGIAILCIFK